MSIDRRPAIRMPEPCRYCGSAGSLPSRLERICQDAKRFLDNGSHDHLRTYLGLAADDAGAVGHAARYLLDKWHESDEAFRRALYEFVQEDIPMKKGRR